MTVCFMNVYFMDACTRYLKGRGAVTLTRLQGRAASRLAVNVRKGNEERRAALIQAARFGEG
ncbi:hypothetical protein EF878_10080 [Dickeya undicola]|uniref:Uncharacterized protein n=1 Tax=Dickeya undicola TaxID=1577887 RepID=A0A3N0G1Q8_9GAMM|nr:hypothetical protein EF878_10080 [Dickeya undicola]